MAGKFNLKIPGLMMIVKTVPDDALSDHKENLVKSYMVPKNNVDLHNPR